MSKRSLIRLVAAVALGAAASLALPALPAVGTHSPLVPHDIEIAEPMTLVAKGAGVIVPVEVTCPSGSTGFVSVRVTQRRGNRVSTGFGGTTVECTGATQTVEVLVTADQGAFKKGTALAEARLTACPAFPGGCVEDTDFEEISITT
jgi:hypothetical protein